MAPRFALFVRCVPGRLVTRFGNSRHYIGVRDVLPPPSREEKLAGAPTHVWHEDEVVPITEAEYRRYAREYDGAIRRGDLVNATEDEHRLYQLSLEEPDA